MVPVNGIISNKDRDIHHKTYILKATVTHLHPYHF